MQYHQQKENHVFYNLGGKYLFLYFRILFLFRSSRDGLAEGFFLMNFATKKPML
jgi:hypothetical protein